MVSHGTLRLETVRLQKLSYRRKDQGSLFGWEIGIISWLRLRNYLRRDWRIVRGTAILEKVKVRRNKAEFGFMFARKEASRVELFMRLLIRLGTAGRDFGRSFRNIFLETKMRLEWAGSRPNFLQFNRI
jgi:hypothetical protein